MKRHALFSIGLFALSASMIIEMPIFAAGSAQSGKLNLSGSNQQTAAYVSEYSESDENLPLTSRTEYGLIYNNRYPKSTEELLRKYITENAELYLTKGLDSSFAYFNADQYLAAYPELKETLQKQLAAEGKSGDAAALKKLALLHYLQYGMLEGRKSGTAFDPVIALMAYPELYTTAGASLTPDAVRAAFRNAIHAVDTTEFRIYFYYLNDDSEQFAVQRIRKDNETAVSTSSTGNNDSSGSHSNSNSDFQPVIPNIIPAKINNLAKDIRPYRLYSRTGDSDELSISGTATTNYDTISDKKSSLYTMMFYYCGTNLEDNGKGTLTESVVEMLKAAPKNMNVILLIGGTDSYSSNYLNKLKDEKVGIYYLNSSVLTDADWAKYNNTKGNARYDAVINENTLVELSSLDATNLGNAALLSGFINMSTDLFPADDYGLVFWNHGGGVMDGVCGGDTTVVKNADALNTDELESALHSSSLVQKGGKLGLLAFDACLMGSSEIAYNLHNYYNYMYGCEEIEMGDFKYSKMLSKMDETIAAGIGDKTDYEIAKVIFDNFSYYTSPDDNSHIGTGDLQQTGSVFDGNATEQFTVAINDMAAKINALIEAAPQEGKDVLSTIAMARMKCETIGVQETDYLWNTNEVQYCDVGEFAQFLKEDLETLRSKATAAGYLNALQEAIDSINALQKQGNLRMTSTWYNMNFVRGVYNESQAMSMESLVTDEDLAPKNFWLNTQGTKYSYGASIYFPLVGNCNNTNYTKFGEYYSGTALADYTTLITKMENWKESEGYKTQLSDLKKEIKSINKFTSQDSITVAHYEDAQSPNYLEVNFNNTYADTDEVKDSFGSAAFDTIVSLYNSPRMYAAEENSITNTTTEEGTTIETNYDKVVIANYISGEHFDVADSRMSMQAEDLTQYGVYQEGTTQKDTLDYKIIFGDTELDGDLKSNIAKTWITGYTSSDSSNVKILYGGTVSSADSLTYDYTYHIFKKAEDANNTYNYVGTASYNDNAYQQMGATSVYFYDYFLKKTTEGITNLVVGVGNFTGDTTFDADYVSKYTRYDVTEGSNQLTLRQNTLARADESKYEYAASIDIFYPGDTKATTEFTATCTIPADSDKSTNTKEEPVDSIMAAAETTLEETTAAETTAEETTAVETTAAETTAKETTAADTTTETAETSAEESETEAQPAETTTVIAETLTEAAPVEEAEAEAPAAEEAEEAAPAEEGTEAENPAAEEAASAEETSAAEDSGDIDSGTEDSGSEDSGNNDSGTEDSGSEDSGNNDSGTEDSGSEDSGDTGSETEASVE